MKFTLSWLKDHLETQADLPLILKKLVDLGLEVESVYNPADALKDIVVAQVVSRQKHPNADRLNVCTINKGDDDLIQVVCGAPNVREGMKVAFAPLGTLIPATGVVLKKGKIRDVESFGMLCSAKELNLSTTDEGTILDIETQALPGSPFSEILGLNDPVIDISLTPNRSDCFGVRGIARELAAADLGTLKPLPGHNPTLKTAPCPFSVQLISHQGCSQFSGILIQGVQNNQSPIWVQNRLKAAGLRPLNALVDATTYLCLDLCRPLHVFDADTLNGQLQIRFAQQGETFVSLEGKTYTLDDTMTVIADESGVISLGGIMGGLSTACTDKTTSVFLECALFDPIRIAKTGRKVGILSDARTRFERGIDPESQVYGLWRAAHLIHDWCGGTISLPVIQTDKKAAAFTKSSDSRTSSPYLNHGPTKFFEWRHFYL